MLEQTGNDVAKLCKLYLLAAQLYVKTEKTKGFIRKLQLFR